MHSIGELLHSLPRKASTDMHLAVFPHTASETTWHDLQGPGPAVHFARQISSPELWKGMLFLGLVGRRSHLAYFGPDKLPPVLGIVGFSWGENMCEIMQHVLTA